MINNYIVYKHTTPNNKTYIGITSQSVNRRWRNGGGYRSSVLFNNAITKYGWNCIRHEILAAGLSQKEAEKMEIAFIKQSKSNLSQYGYNIDNGGNSVGKLSYLTKQKIRNANLGKVLSVEVRQKLSESQKIRYRNETPEQKIIRLKSFPSGTLSPMYGRHHSEKTKQILRIKNGGKNSCWFGRKHTKEEITKISSSHKKQIVQFDLNHETIKQYSSLTEASVYTGISTSMISQVCNGKRKPNNFNWKYL